jgi:hypothetical protein
LVVLFIMRVYIESFLVGVTKLVSPKGATIVLETIG